MSAEFDLPGLQAKLTLEATTKSYGELSDSYGVNKGILWRIVHQGYEPRRQDIREALGLPVRIELSPANGAVAQPGSLFIRSSVPCACGCGISFIPRHPQQRYLPGHRKHRVSPG